MEVKVKSSLSTELSAFISYEDKSAWGLKFQLVNCLVSDAVWLAARPVAKMSCQFWFFYVRDNDFSTLWC
mgnify:CR=1 FL=1